MRTNILYQFHFLEINYTNQRIQVFLSHEFVMLSYILYFSYFVHGYFLLKLIQSQGSFPIKSIEKIYIRKIVINTL